MTKLRCMLCCLMICTITIDARTVNDITMAKNPYGQYLLKQLEQIDR